MQVITRNFTAGGSRSRTYSFSPSSVTSRMSRAWGPPAILLISYGSMHTMKGNLIAGVIFGRASPSPLTSSLPPPFSLSPPRVTITCHARAGFTHGPPLLLLCVLTHKETFVAISSPAAPLAALLPLPSKHGNQVSYARGIHPRSPASPPVCVHT